MEHLNQNIFKYMNYYNHMIYLTTNNSVFRIQYFDAPWEIKNLRNQRVLREFSEFQIFDTINITPT